jgi:hypothetical protein
MNLERVEQIAKAVLYEGYMLYPYRPSSVKNQQRFNFGVVYPQSYVESSPQEICSMQTKCLITGDANTIVEGRLRFLQLQLRSNAEATRVPPNTWQEAVERDVPILNCTLEALCLAPMTEVFQFPAHTLHREDDQLQQAALEGIVEASTEKLADHLFKLSLRVCNTTLHQPSNRDAALMQSFISTHMLLGAKAGEFISLLEPPETLHDYVEHCKNVGLWPVLVGDPGTHDTMLASPIILYDYPQIAPESPGDLFDGTEIDEILSLRILTLTDEEKAEIRQSDERARQILDRTESMPVEQFMKLHGALRGLRPLHPDSPQEDTA